MTLEKVIDSSKITLGISLLIEALVVRPFLSEWQVRGTLLFIDFPQQADNTVFVGSCASPNAFGTSQTRKTLSEMSEWEERVGIEKVVYEKNI